MGKDTKVRLCGLKGTTVNATVYAAIQSTHQIGTPEDFQVGLLPGQFLSDQGEFMF
jgi:hypothetical protein